MKLSLEKAWFSMLKKEFDKDYFHYIYQFLEEEYQQNTVFPAKEKVFSAFQYCTFDNLKVVLLGQDPYHGKNQANGLAFSVNESEKLPPSLKNIFKELHDDLGVVPTKNGNLEHWAKQGVLLLNTTLTVQEKSPNSHQNIGWNLFTDEVIQTISSKKKHVVFLLWGNHAIQKASLIDKTKHLILISPHPSPFSAHKGFFGNKHFSKTNDYLISKGIQKIDW